MNGEKKAFPAVAVTFIYALSNDLVDRNLLCSRRFTIIVITLCTTTAKRDDRHKSGTAQKDRRGDCDRIDPRPTAAARRYKTQWAPPPQYTCYYYCFFFPLVFAGNPVLNKPKNSVRVISINCY